MSGDGPMLPWERAQTAQRKRAALTLGGLALVAVLLVVVMLYFLNGSSANDGKQVAGPTDVASSPVTTASTPTRSTPATRATSTTPPPKPRPTRTRLTCSTKPACVVPGDPGDVVRAVNTYRTSHGQQPVPGSVSRAAQSCAVNNGDGPSCPQSYFWEPVPGRDGSAVITKIAAKGDGARFLLDPQLKAVEIGWAYFPSSGGYECAVVNVY